MTQSSPNGHARRLAAPAAFALLTAFLLGFPPAFAAPAEASPAASPEIGGEAPSTVSASAKKRGKKGKGGDAEKGAEEGEEDKWSVAEPPLPTKEIEIDVQEGTWISLDVSPDGETLVFDLLGDLYSLPMAGGEATALTQGLAWDMQPRFSPDGTSIAFTSDRAGGDNVWVMDADGSNARAVSDESFRLLNSPTWTPDGDYLAARKHFTSTRSLGAGEIWLYHRSGGKGVQMTEKPNDQKDVGEPAFSPDGRYLYYSQDVTPGGTFEYNKDPNSSIYAIQRLDRDSGHTETLVSGPGGAIRPTPSPDGRYLAFVRRVRFQSVLHLYDLESGAERAIFDGLDRDMQETWAIHGVYPAMAWTPDSKAVVTWGGGKIWKVDAATGEAQEIPFHVKARHTLVEALRSSQQADADAFKTRMLRWVQTSPGGDKAVFEALGVLYVKNLVNGSVRRLTGQDGHAPDGRRELYPSFSRDGKWIAFATWNDEKLGEVRVAPVAGGPSRVVTQDPGHYVEPVISPDGATVVYRKIQGGWLRPPLWSQDPGIYRVPILGGEGELILRDGDRPHFGSSADRVYYRRTEGDHRILSSVELDGSDPRDHVKTAWASNLQVSPDGRWVAFTERFHGYVAPLPETGRAISLGPDTKDLPMKRVTRDAGESLHWSGDASRLYWSLGPELFHADLSQVFTFLEGTPEEAAEPPASGVDLGFSVPRYAPRNLRAFVGGKILTMDGDRMIENGTVVVDGHRIVTVGPAGEVTVPEGAEVIELDGRTLMPGIVDVHWHGSQGSNEFIPQQNWNNYATLAFGVTTIHDPSNDTSEFFAAAELAKAGHIVAPRLFSTGTILYGAKTSFTAEVESLDDARTHLRRMKAVGAFSVKSYNQPRRDQRQQMLAAARELDMLVMPEGGSVLQHNLTMVADGHTGVEHSIPVAKIYDDIRQFWSQSETAYTPTLVVGYGGIWGERYWYHHTNVWENERLLSFVPRRVVDSVARRREMAPEEEYNHISNAAVATELARLGVDVTVGAHGQREGLGSHWEIWSFVQGGMTPLEALQAATIAGARYLGMDSQIGTIEEGKLADLIVLDEDPLEDIRNSESVAFVMVGGRLFDARTMDEIGGKRVKKEPFFFQEGGLTAGCSTGSCSAPASAVCHH